MRFKDKVAIVTGGTGGIGKGIARKLGIEGAKIVLVDMNSSQDTSIEFEKLGIQHMNVACDVTNTRDVEQMVISTLEKFGTVDILVTCAGILRDAFCHRMTEEQWDQVIDVHLKGTFLCTRQILPILRQKKSGSIICISSVAGKGGNIAQCNYSAAKAGVVGFMKAVARENAKLCVRANAIQPGLIDTEFIGGMPPEIKKEKIDRIPLGRIGNTDDVANLVAFLASDEASWITGEVFGITGGTGMLFG